MSLPGAAFAVLTCACMCQCLLLLHSEEMGAHAEAEEKSILYEAWCTILGKKRGLGHHGADLQELTLCLPVAPQCIGRPSIRSAWQDGIMCGGSVCMGSCACVLLAHAAPCTHGSLHGSPSWHQSVHTPKLVFKVSPCALTTLLACQG